MLSCFMLYGWSSVPLLSVALDGYGFSGSSRIGWLGFARRAMAGQESSHDIYFWTADDEFKKAFGPGRSLTAALTATAGYIYTATV